MPSPLESEIRTHLARYVAGVDSIDDFDAWFVPETWGIPDGSAKEMADHIWLHLAEYTNGDWSESELKEELRSLAVSETAGVN